MPELTIIEKLLNKAKDINNTTTTVVEKTAILGAIEVFTTGIVLGDAYLNSSILKKFRIKTSKTFREKERVRLETTYLFVLLGIKVGAGLFDNPPAILTKYDTNKVIAVLVESLVKRGFNLLDLPNLALNALK